jgi:hypothetical protein
MEKGQCLELGARSSVFGVRCSMCSVCSVFEVRYLKSKLKTYDDQSNSVSRQSGNPTLPLMRARVFVFFPNRARLRLVSRLVSLRYVRAAVRGTSVNKPARRAA